jgi:hypothetical protein
MSKKLIVISLSQLHRYHMIPVCELCRNEGYILVACEEYMMLHVKSLQIGARMRALCASARSAHFDPGRVCWRENQIRVVTRHQVPLI